MKSIFDYAKNIDRGGKRAEMFIYDEISDEKINGRHFANELKHLIEVDNITDIDVRINSIGGGVMHAFSIFSAISEANKRPGVAVNTFNDGLAASSAAWLLLAGKNIFPKDYSRLMIHGVLPIGDDGQIKKDLSEADRVALTQFKNIIKEVIFAKTGIVPSYIDELLTNGRDNWFTAEEAADIGFFSKHNIQKTGLEIDLPEDLRRDALHVANQAQKIIENNFINSNPVQMKKVINALKLQEGVSEEVVLVAVENALKEASDAKTALETVSNSLTEATATIAKQKTELDAANRSGAVLVVENAIKEGKIAPKNDDEKNGLIETCLKDVESFKNTLSLVPLKAANVLNQIDKQNGAGSDIIGKIANRSYRELEKNEPTLLNEIKNTAPSEFVKLYNAQYKTQKTEADFK